MVNVQETGVQLPGTTQCIVSTTFNICPRFLLGGSPTIFEKCSHLNIFSSRKPEVMLPIIFLVFPVISLLEKDQLLLNAEKRSCVTPPPPPPPSSNVQKTFPVAKLICESSLIIILAIYLPANFAIAPCTGVAGLQILLAMAMQ